jgi:hypothetical protein
VDHVAGPKNQQNGLADWYLERGAGEIVFAGRVIGIDAERIAVGIVNLLDVQAPELAIGTRVAKAPANRFPLPQCARIGGASAKYRGPDARPARTSQ